MTPAVTAPMNQYPRPERLGYAGLVESLSLLGAAGFRNRATMGNRFCSLLLSLAWLFVGYPANLLADALDTARYRHQTLFDLLRQAAAHLAPRGGAELTLMGLMVALSAFILSLWLLPV